VDAVSDVLNASAADIRDTPNFGAGVATEYISGLVSADNSMIMLLDVDRMLNEDIEADTGAEEAA
jgi:purine-binding chemotaxis protein CheW